MPSRRHFQAALLAAALAGAGIGSSRADTAYPSRPITLVVGFSAGSSIDMVARAVAQRLGEKLGQAVVVENRAGAGGNVAAQQVAQAAPDGYRLLVVANSIAIGPAIYDDLKFDVKKDLRGIAYIGAGPVILKVSAGKGIDSLPALVREAKAHPGKLNFGSSGVGGTPHMAAELFDQVAGIRMTHIPYKGGSDALTALMAGEIDVLINPLLGDVSSDKVKSLAVSGSARSPQAPDVPTFAELGYPSYDMNVYYGLMGPSGLPDDIVAKLNKAVNEVLAMPALVDALTTRSGIALRQGSAAEFQAFIARDVERWQAVVRNDKRILAR